MHRRKHISPQQITGQQGVNLVEREVLAMGFAWHPTNQALDAGIDGIIEIRDPQIGVATNNIIQVQVKATTRKWTYESSSEFTYRCEPEDVEYWLRGNTPVILVAVRPEGDEAYWVNIKEAFVNDRYKTDTHVRFNKQTQRFDRSAAAALLRTAVPRDVGPYLPAPAKREELISNLLRIRSLPPHIYIACTDYRDPKEIIAWAKNRDMRLPTGWFLAEGMIYSFHDLREGVGPDLCDVGSIETFDVDEWSETEDLDRRRQFVRLLNQTFRGDMRIRRLWRSPDENCYFFPAHWQDEQPRSRTYHYRSLQQKTTSEVVKVQPHREGGVWYCRHDAFQHTFLKFHEMWHLVITPHYVFTTDGRTPHPNGEEWLSGLKKQERQKAVLGQVVMWRHKLTEQSQQLRLDQVNEEQTLIGFDDLTRFECGRGIDDADWLPGDRLSQENDDGDPTDGGLFA